MVYDILLFNTHWLLQVWTQGRVFSVVPCSVAGPLLAVHTKMELCTDRSEVSAHVSDEDVVGRTGGLRGVQLGADLVPQVGQIQLGQHSAQHAIRKLV